MTLGCSLALLHPCPEPVGLTGFGIHSLRHLAATQMLAAGVPVKTVAGRLGHANAAITLNVYPAFLASSDQEAAAVMGRALGGRQPGEVT